MKFSVDYDRCEGHSLCVAAAPDLIEIGDDELAHVVVDELAPAQHPAAEHAIRSCPKQALRLENS
ncbi:ferredoxin [Nocardia sp. BSTN01]|uniref:ferredoxin n=1 Tax=Nocardia sp. BSTN01 TaxID=2783665 RepID=UPI001890855F|nr:ferredoxin [Nocardia sp. BSTN01]MBF4997282.1 ferredoxin [Nocardia sp. BSTN01]